MTADRLTSSAEPWRRPDPEEFGNAIPSPIDVGWLISELHRDARNTLPPGTRYDLRCANLGFVGQGGIAWYRNTAMDAEPLWGSPSNFGLRNGYYLVGQYVTPSRD